MTQEIILGDIGIWEFIKQLMSPESIIKYGGLLLILAVVFAESGVFFAFWMPGDSLLFTTGLFCQLKILDYSLPVLLISLFIASFLGYLFGYYFGMKSGKHLLRKKNSLFFKARYVAMARLYFKKFGGKTLVIGRFLPVIRTFAPILAGMILMDFKKFLFFNVMGGIFWVLLLVCFGYIFGQFIPEPEKYLKFIVIGLVVFTALPLIKTIFRKKDVKRVRIKKPGEI